jgi:hypothetical protein
MIFRFLKPPLSPYDRGICKDNNIIIFRIPRFYGKDIIYEILSISPVTGETQRGQK